MSTTAGNIITAALQKAGIDSPTAAQTASALISLNNMISLQGADFMPPVVVRESFSLSLTDPEYTIGPSGQWNTVRPIQISTCFLRDGSNNDYPLKVFGPKDYSVIYNKRTSGMPDALYFIPEYPIAKIIFNSIPTISTDAHLESRKNFTEFATTSTVVDLPTEYKEFFVYNLAVSVAEDWDRVISKTVMAKAVDTKTVIERLLASNRPAQNSRFDFGPMGSGRQSVGSTPIYSGGSPTITVDGGAF